MVNEEIFEETHSAASQDLKTRISLIMLTAGPLISIVISRKIGYS